MMCFLKDCFCPFTRFVVRVDSIKIVINCATKGNGKADLFLAYLDVRVFMKKLCGQYHMFYLHHERYFDVISSS